MTELDAVFRQLSTEIGKHLGAPTVPDGPSAFAIELPAAGQRKQRVTLTLDQDRLGNPIIVLSSTCGSAEHVDPNTALRINAQLPYGGLGIAGEDMVLRAGCYIGERAVSVPELVAMIRHVAAYADRIEHGLYGDIDRF